MYRPGARKDLYHMLFGPLDWETSQGVQQTTAQITTKKFSSISSFELILELGWITPETCCIAGIIFSLLVWVKNCPIIWATWTLG